MGVVIKARRVQSYDDLKQVGDFYWNVREDGKRRFICFVRPGEPVTWKAVTMIEVGGSGWGWDGNEEQPTLTPSIWVNKGKANPDAGEWHGYLTKGEFVSC